jgi:hypothetical protein
MTLMSLQREIDWKILEGAKLGAQQAPPFSVRESRYTSDFANLAPNLDRSSVSEIVRANRLQSCTKAGLRTSVKRELRRTHVL